MNLNEDLYSVEEMLCMKATERKVPINGILELTPLCNMNCEMCFVRMSPGEMEKKGRLRTLEEWCAFADAMQKAGTLFVLLTGGEPLTYPGFKELYLHLKKLGMILTINTNGTLIDEEWAEFFGKHKPRRINITIYGKDADTYGRLCHNPGGYEKAVKAIRLLREQKVDVKLNGSITPENVKDWEEILKLAKKLDVPYKVDTYMYPASRERAQGFCEEARLKPEAAAEVAVNLMKWENTNYLKQAKDFVCKAEADVKADGGVQGVSCRAGRSSFVINWQGRMRPCIMVTTPEVPAEPENFEEAWKKIVAETAAIRTSTVCSNCVLRENCAVCAACALLETGNYDGTPEYMCRYTKEIYRRVKQDLQEAEEGENDGVVL